MLSLLRTTLRNPLTRPPPDGVNEMLWLTFAVTGSRFETMMRRPTLVLSDSRAEADVTTRS
jgi:hypothetical protein